MTSPFFVGKNSSKKERPRILVFVDHYLPGYKAGGPICTISNMVEQLGAEFQFLIVTRDRDLRDQLPYIDVKINDWNTVGHSSVFYVSPDKFNLLNIARLMRDTNHDILYLNSYFSSRTTGIPLLARRLNLCPSKPAVIAPRGEFSEGALAIKSIKKKLYIKVASFANVYQGLTWHASSNDELRDIQREMASTVNRVVVAPNLISNCDPSNHNVLINNRVRMPGPLRVIFLSRISPKKNLDHLLRVLQRVVVSVELNIYGPNEDHIYWNKCQQLIKQLPSNITVNYHGAITPSDVSSAFQANDVFVFPTHGENFGHVIIEALTAGTAVIVSDQTPWKPDDAGACQVIPLANVEEYALAIRRWAALSDEELASRRMAALEYARLSRSNNDRLKANLDLFMGMID